MRIKAVCFDIDGTLYPNWKMYYHTMRSFFLDPVLVKKYGEARVEIREMDASIPREEGFHRLQAELVARRFGRKHDATQMEQRIEHHLYQVWEKSFRGVKPFHGVKDFLLMLREKGLLLGALSDFPIQNKLRYLGLSGGIFDIKLCAEDTGYLKPHAKPFEELIQACGCEPGEILYVGNSYDKDVVGAKNAGMLAAHITSKKLPGSVADLNFKNYAELEKKLKKLMID